MIRVVILLQPGEAKALRATCRRFRFEDAMRFLRGIHNIAPDAPTARGRRSKRSSTIHRAGRGRQLCPGICRA